jgi:thymidylate synthase (FAD)
MLIIKPSFHIESPIDGQAMLKRIEAAGRTCYRSEGRIAPGSAPDFVRRIMRRGHQSVIEHESVTVRFICDRGVSHELVRHRLASYSQESTRYCDYSPDGRVGGLVFILPRWLESEQSPGYGVWEASLRAAEHAYISLRSQGWTPQQARAVLPNSLKTEIVMTANLREWRHVFQMRADVAAHPQMRELMVPLLAEFKRRIPVIFDDIYPEPDMATAKAAVETAA